MRLALIAVLSFAAAPAFAAVTPIASLERGQSATISGTVERITDEDEFRLRDDSGAIIVYLGPTLVPVSTGEQVSVEGFVDADLGRKELYARSLTRQDGSTVTLSHSYD